jgi:hypothetical protein
MYKAVRLKRTRADHVSDVAFVIVETVLLADLLAHVKGNPGNVVITAVLLLFIVVSLPLSLLLYSRMEDELQRSLVSTSDAIAFAGTLLGAFGYRVLQTVDHLRVLSPIAFVAGGVALWFATWLALRVRTA